MVAISLSAALRPLGNCSLSVPLGARQQPQPRDSTVCEDGGGGTPLRWQQQQQGPGSRVALPSLQATPNTPWPGDHPTLSSPVPPSSQACLLSGF